MGKLAFAVFTVLLCSLAYALEPADGFDCVLCHPARDKAVFEKLERVYGEEVRTLSARSVVCISCHDGSLLDSRDILGPKAQGHPLGVRMEGKSGARLPLYGDSRLECATCHTPHPENSTSLKRPGWLRGEAGKPFPCADCHEKAASGLSSHLNLATDAKARERVAAAGGTFTKDGRITCATCHAPHGGKGPKLLLLPYAREGENTLCRLCHAEGKGQVSHPLYSVQGREIPPEFPLSPNGVLTCATCHPPHGVADETAAVGLRTPGGVTAPCLPCHPAIGGSGFGHMGEKLSQKAVAAVKAAGAKAGKDSALGCLSCHVVHQAPEAKLLTQPFFDGKAFGLCVQCHKATEVTGKISEAKSQPCTDCHQLHLKGPKVSPKEREPCGECHAAKGGTGDHPLSGGCGSCHAVHQPVSKKGHLKSKWEGDLLCRGCHATGEYGHALGRTLEVKDNELLLRRGIRLDPGHKVGCPTCHTVHGAKELSLLNANEEILCLYCHDAENPFGGGGLKAGAHPVGTALSKEQQGLLGKASKTIPKSAGETARAERFSKVLSCSSCHRSHKKAVVTSVTCEKCHPDRISQSHQREEGCLTCHPTHTGAPPATLCAGCHKSVKDTAHQKGHDLVAAASPAVGDDGKLGETGKIGCPTCHNPHGDDRRLLRGANPTSLCLNCHTSKAELAKGPHFTGKPGEKSGCEVCHPVHGKEVDERSQKERCADCHKSEMGSAKPHSASGSLGLWTKSGGLPLFDAYGRRNEYGLVDCPTCHDVHKPSGAMAMRLPVTAAPALCFSCHPEKQALLNTPHDSSQGGRKTDDAPCHLCHRIHQAGGVPPTWELSSEAQGTLNDRKCSPCHGPPQDGPGFHAGPRSHPVNTPMREGQKAGSLKLFDPLGGQGGRLVVCSTCHNIHGEADETGNARPNLLRLAPESGSLCLNCHEEKGAIRATPHEKAGGANQPLGPCSPCHMVHAAGEIGFLWGLAPFPEGIPQNRRCKSCHSRANEKGLAVPRLYHHMTDAEPALNRRGAIYLQRPLFMTDEVALALDEKSPLPLYGRDGMMKAEGFLACTSCHDPHRWSSESPDIKPMENAKWLGYTKYVRQTGPEELRQSVCSDCHGEKAADYFKGYHKVWFDP